MKLQATTLIAVMSADYAQHRAAETAPQLSCVGAASTDAMKTRWSVWLAESFRDQRDPLYRAVADILRQHTRCWGNLRPPSHSAYSPVLPHNPATQAASDQFLDGQLAEDLQHIINTHQTRDSVLFVRPVGEALGQR